MPWCPSSLPGLGGVKGVLSRSGLPSSATVMSCSGEQIDSFWIAVAVGKEVGVADGLEVGGEVGDWVGAGREGCNATMAVAEDRATGVCIGAAGTEVQAARVNTRPNAPASRALTGFLKIFMYAKFYTAGRLMNINNAEKGIPFSIFAFVAKMEKGIEGMRIFGPRTEMHPSLLAD